MKTKQKIKNEKKEASRGPKFLFAVDRYLLFFMCNSHPPFASYVSPPFPRLRCLLLAADLRSSHHYLLLHPLPLPFFLRSAPGSKEAARLPLLAAASSPGGSREVPSTRRPTMARSPSSARRALLAAPSWLVSCALLLSQQSTRLAAGCSSPLAAPASAPFFLPSRSAFCCRPGRANQECLAAASFPSTLAGSPVLWHPVQGVLPATDVKNLHGIG